MASNIDISGLTMNPLEVDSISEFIIEKISTDPTLNSIHAVWTGIKMKEQIVFASQLGLTGIKDTTCARPNSGAESVLTQKYWDPENIGDTLIHCQTDVDSLFKAYYTKITKYVDLFDISGSDLEKFFLVMLSEAAMLTVWRVAWFGDTAVAASGAGAAGLILVGNVAFYDQIDGLWKQIFAGVVATTIAHTTVKVAALNAQVTIPLQTTLAVDDADAVFADMWTKADVRLRQDSTAQFLVTRELFDNWVNTLDTAGRNFTLDYALNGLPTVKWRGITVVNMESLWDLRLRADFEQNSTSNAYYLPNRAVLTTPANIPIGTLNESDMSDLDVFYDQIGRQSYSSYGFTEDAKVLEEYMIVAAY